MNGDATGRSDVRRDGSSRSAHGDHDEPPGDPRARRAWRIAGFGSLLVGGLMAGTAAATGGGGRTGMVFFLLGCFLSTGVATLYAIVTGALDTYHQRPVGRARVIAAAVLGCITAFVIPPMLIGLAG